MSVSQVEGSAPSERSDVDVSAIEKYLDYVSEPEREMYTEMARQQVEAGPFTYEDIGARIGTSRHDLYNHRRVVGRRAGSWRRRHGSEPPIRPVEAGDVPNRQIKLWRFPDGVAEAILEVADRDLDGDADGGA